MKNLFVLCFSLMAFLLPAAIHASITARFSVDLTKYVQSGVFKTGSDKVYLCGNFNNWEKNIEMLKDASGFVYRASIQVEKYTYYEYKYCISSPGAANGGFEDSVGAASGKRFFNFWGFDKVLPVDFFNNEEPSSSHITITSPAAGQCWPAGSAQTISWNVSGISNLKLEYTTDGGQTWQTIVISVPASDGKYNWTLPEKFSYEYRIRISDVSNPSDVKYSSGLMVIYPQIAASVSPLLKIEYPVFQYPLNALYPPTISSDTEIINGKVGNACGPTVIANILRYWEFPIKGTGSRFFTDHLDCKWSADFQGAVYEYDRMPGNIPFNAPDSVYKATALLMYHAGVGMHNVWRSGAQDGIVEAMHEYFNYSKKSKFLERANYTPEQWDKIVKSELSAGKPLLSAGPGHWFIVDGYTTDNLFHVRWDYGEANDQYLPLYSFKPYEGNHWIFAYLEPERNGRSIHLTYPNGGELLQKAQSVSIKWESAGISNVQLEYTTNNGYDWIQFANNIPSSSGSYIWNVNAGSSLNCKVRISASEDINIYDKSDAVFSCFDVKELKLYSAVYNYLQSGVIIPLRWQAKGIAFVVIQYSQDDGATWKNAGEADGSTGLYYWTVPDIEAGKCRIKLYDKSDPTLASLSGIFSIGKVPAAGGPFINDANTAALLHFDNNYKNEQSNAAAGQPFNNISFESNYDLGLDYCAKIDNSGSTSSVVNVPNYNEVNLSADWTIELWFKISTWGSGSTAYPYLLWKGGSNFFVILNVASKSLSAGYDYEGGAERITLPQNCLVPGKWYQLTFTRSMSNNTLKCLLFDSGRQIVAAVSGIFNPAHTPKITANPVSIGGSSMNGNIQFDGYVDEVRISNIARNISSLALTSPSAGEKLRTGSSCNIKWSAVNVLKVKLEYTTNNGQTWMPISSGIDASSGSYLWTIPDINSKFCKVRISDQVDGSVNAACRNVFWVIPAAAVTLVSPNGGESWNSGTEQYITWNAAGIDSVKIDFMQNTGSSWYTLHKAYPADSSRYKWIIPPVVSRSCKIRISDAADTSVYDQCDGAFSIADPSSLAEKTTAGIPVDYYLQQNFPNPFNPVTVVNFAIPEAGDVSLVIYDVLGHKVKELVNEYKSAGFYKAEFNAMGLPSGTYIYRLRSGNFSQTRKLLLLK